MWLYLSVAVGGAIGSAGRHFVNAFMTERFGTFLPYGTLLVNVAGSFLIGLLFYLASENGRFEMGENTKQLLISGFCGGFTTFSAFSLQTLILLKENAWLRAGTYVAGSVLLCMLFVWLGFLLSKKLMA